MKILFIGLIFLCACNQSVKETNLVEDQPLDEPSTENIDEDMELEIFTKLPTEIEGCSCYFSKDSLGFAEQRYIFVDNFEDVAFIKLNGKLVRLTRKNTKEFDDNSVKTVYRNENYKLSVKVFEGESSGDEAWLNQGTIRLRSIKTGEVVETEFFGECGC